MNLTNNQLLIIACIMVLIVAVLVLLTAALVVLALRQITQAQATAAEQQAIAENPELQQVYELRRQAQPQNLWQLIDKQLTDAVPLAQEADIMLHHNYDGIRELDNHLPPWWKWMFYATIVFAVLYIPYYHFSAEDRSSNGEFVAEVEQAEVAIAEYKKKSADAIDETNVTLTSDAADLDAGKTLFAENCKACHGSQGEGGVGPNLTDAYWLHGGDVKDIFKSIKFGIPEKGMISWKAKFKPNELRAISSYILKIQGTNPPNAKAPQGQLVGNAAGAAPAPATPAADSANTAQSTPQKSTQPAANGHV